MSTSDQDPEIPIPPAPEPRRRGRPTKAEMLARFGNGLRSNAWTSTNNPGRSANSSRNLIYRALYNAATEKNGALVERIARKVLNMAADGNMDAVNFVTDRLDGKLKQTVEHEGSNPQIAFVIATADDLRQKIRGLPAAELAPPPALPLQETSDSHES